MITDYDPIKSIREEIAGLADVHAALRRRERFAEGQLGEAEAELNALRKLTGFASMELNRKRNILRQLEEEATK